MKSTTACLSPSFSEDEVIIVYPARACAARVLKVIGFSGVVVVVVKSPDLEI